MNAISFISAVSYISWNLICMQHYAYVEYILVNDNKKKPFYGEYIY